MDEVQLDAQKQIKQTRVSMEIQIDDLEKENEAYRQKLEEADDGQVLSEKIEYWKLKAKKEAERVEELERKIMQHGDKSILTKLFGQTIK